MVEELAEAVVRAAGAAARGVASMLSVPETYAAAEFAAEEGDRPRKRRTGKDGKGRERP
ncbi:hypothetical protein AB1388_31120 [Streptomyces hydrogenans]|uniref:hypothetical protein n=1 Tax=Streptomyces hydrogenans TaxID=1873719 RepID=UPI00345C7F4A